MAPLASGSEHDASQSSRWEFSSASSHLSSGSYFLTLAWIRSIASFVEETERLILCSNIKLIIMTMWQRLLGVPQYLLSVSFLIMGPWFLPAVINKHHISQRPLQLGEYRHLILTMGCCDFWQIFLTGANILFHPCFLPLGWKAYVMAEFKQPLLTIKCNHVWRRTWQYYQRNLKTWWLWDFHVVRIIWEIWMSILFKLLLF